MEVETAHPPSGSGSSLAGYPQWVTLEQHGKSTVDEYPCPTADTKTLAAARTSTGHLIQLSLRLQEPPATSAVLVEFPDGGVDLNYCLIMAAHSDSLLFAVNTEQGYYRHRTQDYFVYTAGNAAADPPRPLSLFLLLPRNYPGESDDDCRRYPGLDSDAVNRNLQLHTDRTAILRPRGTGEDEVVVAELNMVAVSEDAAKPKAAELFLFRSGEWSVKRPEICCGSDDENWELPSDWSTSSVFPVDDRILCWVDDTCDNGGILICDVLEENPCLQYMPLPSVPTVCFGRRVCATGDSRALKFVNIFPRCCCGGVGISDRQRSHCAYTINTWSLRMDSGMEWVMDGMVDATELWSLDTYKDLPRVPLGFPVVSMYEAHVICFALCESYHVRHLGDETLWLLMVDMRSKTIQLVSCHPDWFAGRVLISSNVSGYLNPYPACSSNATSEDQSLSTEMDNNKKKRDDVGTNSMMRSPCKSTEPAAQAYDEILAAFREIPSYGLACDDMLKAYAILSSDNGCRVRSLLRLPMKLRKDWQLMEIKADDA